MLTSTREAYWGLDHDPEAVALARDLAGLIATAWGFGDRLAEIRLVVSELVTNAVIHGKPPVYISMSIFEGDLLIQVTDHGDMWREIDRHIPGELELDEHGRGLLLVEAYATCGTRHLSIHGPGKVVWAQIRKLREPSP